MKLHVGERLPGSGPPSHPGGYVVTGVVTESPWYGLYTGKKILFNFDFAAKRPREAEEKEWLDVYLRTINYPRLDDPTYVAERRTLARAEVRRILSNRTSNLWPEPLDLLEVPNTRDPFTFAPRPPAPAEAAGNPLGFSLLVGTEPVLVFARPQGEPLARWQQKVQPLSWVLGVLAELLQFVQAAHQDGLLLNGLGPGAVLVDRVGRVHYLAADMVVETARGTRLAPPDGDVPPVVDWARHFPPERYPFGFAAPECFDPARPRDRRTDLYGWASLAYFLLTGDRPVQLAQAQGQSWVRFGDPQFIRLNRALRSVPPALVRIWGEQLGVDGETLVRDWPRTFLTVMEHCLRPDPGQRPAAVGDLRAWLMAPPPPPLAAGLAIRVAPERPVRIFLDVRGVDPGLEIVVRRGVGLQPTTAEEGELVSEGPPRPWLEDPGLPPAAGQVCYAAFTRARRDVGVAYSVATPVDVIRAGAPELRQYAEGGAGPDADEPEPPRVRLLFEAFDRLALADILLGSPLPQVRNWAVTRLARDRRAGEAPALLWNALKDPVHAIRLEAARGLLEGASHPPLPLVRQVVEALGAGNPDDCIQAARALADVGVADDVIVATVAAVERDRPVVCPECGHHVAGRDQRIHLVAAHGYLDVSGTLLPRAAALARLWEQTFAQADVPAHHRLCELLGVDATTGGETASKADAKKRSFLMRASPYLAALEAELSRRAVNLLAARWQQVPRLVQCLRENVWARPFFRELLRSMDPLVREIARDLVLPELEDRLAGDGVTDLEVRRELDRICPEELIEEKIQLCLRLPHVGVDAMAAEACLRTLQQERPVDCPECGAPVALMDLQTHLRRAHGVYQFRGTRRPLKDIVGFLLSAVCGPSPDFEAWQALESIVREEHKVKSDAFLASQLGRTLAALAEKKRGQAVAAAAEAIVAGGSGPRLVPVLAAGGPAPDGPAAVHLALEVAARLPAPLNPALLAVVRPLLGDREAPADSRLAAAAALLGSTGKEGKAAGEILAALIAGTGKARAIDRLRQLEQRVGNSPAIEELCARLEDQVRMVCPRCSVQLQRPAMRAHLWDKHRLILEGRRVRDPWRLIEDWIEDYRLERDPALLARGRELARKLDATQGLLRLSRLILSHGIDDPAARADVLAEAGRNGRSVCPHCYWEVPPREESAPAELSVWRGRLSARGYRVEVSTTGLVPWLEAETPGRTLYRGGVPDRWLTRKGALMVLAGIPVGVALVLALALPYLGMPVLQPVLAALGAALVLGLVAFFAWRTSDDATGRAVDFAWTQLVPALHADGFVMEDSAFAAGLALASAGRGNPAPRAGPLGQLRDHTETALLAGHNPVRHLAALWRLTAEDLAATGEDPVPLVVAQVGRCFDGKLPLSFAAQMFDRWDAAWWTAGTLARLRVLLCARAFAAGLEVQDLVEVGRVCPALGAALKTDDPQGLAHLRLLWSLRAADPWGRFGKAVTVFDLAADPESGRLRLARYPDLLVAIEDAPGIEVCGRGLVFMDQVLGRLPRAVEVVARKDGKGYELVVEQLRFPFADDPEETARRLERVARLFFLEFRPQVAAVHRWRAPLVSKTLRSQNAVPCPECHRPVLARVGDVGIPMEVAGDVEPPLRVGVSVVAGGK